MRALGFVAGALVVRLRRHLNLATPQPKKVMVLKPAHPAVIEGRTIFPSRVVDVKDSPRLLVSGMNNRKIGRKVVKGEWAGMPIYTLTLEERATCPTYCPTWATCYGNGMHWPRRHRHGPELEMGIRLELRDLAEKHPLGFVARLHVLGDFYSQNYVGLWIKLLADHDALHIFGYTARAGDDIADHPLHRRVLLVEQRRQFAGVTVNAQG